MNGVGGHSESLLLLASNCQGQKKPLSLLCVTENSLVLLLALFSWSTPSWLKVGGCGGGLVAHLIIVSAPVQRIGFGGFFRLGQDFWVRTWDCWDGGLGLGLDNIL